MYECALPSQTQKISPEICSKKIETLLNHNIEYTGSRERNRVLAMANLWYSVPNEYSKMHEKEWSKLIGMKERYRKVTEKHKSVKQVVSVMRIT